MPPFVSLPPIRTTPPPRHYWQCPEVAPPETEQHIDSLMYEWRRTHDLAMKHWAVMEGPERTTLPMEQHRQEWEQYRAIAAYCQHRIFTLSGWPLPSPGLGFRSYRNQGTPIEIEIYSPRQNWDTPRFWGTSAHLSPEHISPPEPTFPLTRLHLFKRHRR